jgi:purine-binding chemotaxis protein CheW
MQAMEVNGKNKSISYLSFTLGEEVFAAHVSKVQNILEMSKITKVPKAPAYMLGVINLRGAVLPLVDTRIKLGLPVTETTTKTCIIVCELTLGNEYVMTGILVDSVQEVLEIEDEKILAPPNIGTTYRSEFIKGIFNVDETFIMLLDLERIFTGDELLYLKKTHKEEKAEALK